MKPKHLLINALFCLLLAAGVAPAQGGQTAAASELQAQLNQQGWSEISQSVFQRHREGVLETYAFGADGLRWGLQDLESQLGTLVRQYRANPTDELLKTIQGLQERMASLGKELDALSAQGAQPALEAGCDFSYGAHADAFPLSGWSAPGVGATANAYYYNNCNYWGETYAQTCVNANLYGNPTGQCHSSWQQGYSASAYSSLTQGGVQPCSSSAFASVYIYGVGIYLSAQDSNSDCPAPPVDVYISGPTYVFLRGYQCKSVTWYANASGGVPPYSFSWTLNGAYAGSGGSLTQWYCGSGFYDYYEDQVGVTVTDSVGAPDSDSVWVGIESIPIDNCELYLPICPPDPY